MTIETTPDLETAARVARKIKELQAQEAELAEAISNYKDKLTQLLPEGESPVGDNENGYLKVTVYQSRQFNEAYGKKHHPDLWEMNAEERLVLDSATAKRKLSEEEYAFFQKPSDKLSVKVELVGND